MYNQIEILKQKGQLESTTVTRQEYPPKKGERNEVKRPNDTLIFDVLISLTALNQLSPFRLARRRYGSFYNSW